jgi:hypothetical protein
MKLSKNFNIKKNKTRKRTYHKKKRTRYSKRKRTRYSKKKRTRYSKENRTRYSKKKRGGAENILVGKLRRALIRKTEKLIQNRDWTTGELIQEIYINHVYPLAHMQVIDNEDQIIQNINVELQKIGLILKPGGQPEGQRYDFDFISEQPPEEPAEGPEGEPEEEADEQNEQQILAQLIAEEKAIAAEQEAARIQADKQEAVRIAAEKERVAAEEEAIAAEEAAAAADAADEVARNSEIPEGFSSEAKDKSTVSDLEAEVAELERRLAAEKEKEKLKADAEALASDRDELDGNFEALFQNAMTGEWTFTGDDAGAQRKIEEIARLSDDKIAAERKHAEGIAARYDMEKALLRLGPPSPISTSSSGARQRRRSLSSASRRW